MQQLTIQIKFYSFYKRTISLVNHNLFTTLNSTASMDGLNLNRSHFLEESSHVPIFNHAHFLPPPCQSGSLSPGKHPQMVKKLIVATIKKLVVATNRKCKSRIIVLGRFDNFWLQNFSNCFPPGFWMLRLFSPWLLSE